MVRFKLVRRVAVLTLLGALMASFFFIARSPHSFRREASLALRHWPRCLLENYGGLATRRAHYVPGHGTVDILYCTPIAPPNYRGALMQDSLVVVSDFGQAVYRFNRSGELVWQRNIGIARGVDISGQHVYVGVEKDVVVLSAATGAELKRYTLPHHILAIKVAGDSLIVAHDIDQPGAVTIYRFNGAQLQRERSMSQHLRYPRGLALAGPFLYVADTFGHRVVKLDLHTGALVAQQPSFYPNSVAIVNGALLVAEEHLNLISEFALDDLAPLRLRAGIPHAQDGSAVFLARHRSLGFAMASVHPDPRLPLLSPNDAAAAGRFLYVADTDRHRIVVLKDGRWWGQLEGFNNPVNVRTLP